MPVSLNDIAKASKEPSQKAFILDLLRYSDLLKAIPFQGVDGLQVAATRWNTMPSAGFRKLNAGYTESTGTTEEISETLSLLGGFVGGFVESVKLSIPCPTVAVGEFILNC